MAETFDSNSGPDRVVRSFWHGPFSPYEALCLSSFVAAGIAVELFSEAPVSGEMARRFTCDAMVTPIVLGPDGDPLHVGRTRRTFPTRLRRAVAYRDRGCAAPGCHRPPDDCEGHHVRHWADGGPTELGNAQLLCSFHHALAHEGHWRPERARPADRSRPPP